MFKNILLATDFSEHSEVAKKAAISLSRESSKKLTVIYVYSYRDAVVQEGVFLASDVVDKREEELHKERYLAQLEEYCRDIENEGIKPDLKLINHPHPAEAILKYAEEISADLIVIGSHSKRNIFDVLLGGTAEAISKDAPCPVLIVSHFKE